LCRIKWRRKEPCDGQQRNEDQNANRKVINHDRTFSQQLEPSVSSGQKQGEKTKRKGRCQCHAYGERERQCQDCSYLFHGSAPFLVMRRLPEQGKDFRDCHHVLEFSAPHIAQGKQGYERVTRRLGMVPMYVEGRDSGSAEL